MTAPNFANVMEQFAFRVALYEYIEVATKTTTTGYVALETLVITDMDSEFQTEMADGLDASRAALAAALASDHVRATLEPYFLQVGLTIGSTETDVDSIMVDLYDYMVTNDDDVNSRNISFGTPSLTGGGTGNGFFIRQTVDENDFAMEGWLPLNITDDFTAEIIRDTNQIGVEFEEVFRLRGTELAKDDTLTTGSGIDVTLRCQSERDTSRFVKNAGFETATYATTPTVGAETAPSAVDGWTVTTNWTNFLGSVDVLYRTPPGSATSFSLKFVSNDTITQNLLDENNTRFSRDVPYYVGVPIYRKGTATGNVVITLGGTTRTVTLASLADNDWTLVPIVATPDKTLYYENFKLNNLSLSISVNTLAVGTCYVDAIHLFPFQLVGGTGREGRGAMGQYMVAISGETPFLIGDSYTFTDTPNVTRGDNQAWVAHAGLGYLRHVNDGSETIADK